LGSLYRAVAEVSGTRIVVDTSKGPQHALALRGSPGVAIRTCLLVRDSRGVAYSWTRRKPRPEIADGEAYMDNYSVLRSTAEWVSFNAAFGLGPALQVPTLRIRYEDFVRRPREELTRVVRFAGSLSEPPELFGEKTVSLSPDHSMAGNPMRFTSGEVDLVVDDEWRSALPTGQRRLVTALTAPWLLRYGYLGSSGDAHSKSRPR